MSLTVDLPVSVMPRVVYAGQSVHGDMGRQAFIVRGLWGIHLYRYNAEVLMDGRPLEIRPGYAGFTPPGAVMEYRFQGRSTHVFLHVEWPRGTPPDTTLPAVFPVGDRFPVMWERMQEVIPWIGSQAHRASIRGYDLLMDLAELAQGAAGAPVNHPLVARCLRNIEARLSEDLSVAQLADEVGLSQNHLGRLFREHLDTSVLQAIIERRMRRARHLLERSDLPVKEIAAQVGIPNLQHFNKSVRRTFGHSPSGLRRRYHDGFSRWDRDSDRG